MSSAADILCFISTCITPDNVLFTVKYAFNLETLIYWDLNFTNNIFSHLKLCIAVASHNFK